MGPNRRAQERERAAARAAEAAKRAELKKTFAALTSSGYVLFTFKAYDTFTAREIVASLRKGSETIIGVRLLRKDDMGPSGTAEIPQRGSSSKANVPA